jgi:phosphoribosyl-ATP pyrophosphohydrolase/phosphoribosyl-AMP cyclohydrolase
MIIPSIDVMKGRVVQLEQGERLRIERDDALSLARDFARYGEVAVVDLDGALGLGNNTDLIGSLCREAPCRVGGGIRSVEDAWNWLKRGAQKLVIASAAFDEAGGVNVPFLEALVRRVGRERLAVAVDTRQGRVTVKGWRKDVDLSAEDAVIKLKPYCSEFLYTAVDYEGLMKGIDLDGATRLAGCCGDNRLIYAGGVSSLEEIEALTRIGADVQLGMALYSGRLDLTEAFLAGLKWNGDGLIPTVTLDAGGRALMQAWCSREALRKTVESNLATYYSRRRRSLWVKGETSGNSQRWVSFRPDCDSDCLAMVVDPAGPACHSGQASCFGSLPFAWEDLYAVICERLQNAPPGSYTASLDDKLVREKLMEEADEVCRAVGTGEIVWEVADLVYFASVIMARADVKPRQIWGELERRRFK